MVKMDATEKELVRRWVQTWQQAGEALQEVKRRELRSFDYAKHRTLIDEMLQWAYEHRTTRLTSGLVEQQYWFMKIREKLLAQQAQDEEKA